ncbi:hypothetical protein ABID21_001279 [Pseudorhizobium tarimense]|uniref:Uncharacterized protein n=1 Tax=Pseudorhizobium tarimense TaxID=1079109 RepID=A0ABV2H3Q6_9HYPH
MCRIKDAVRPRRADHLVAERAAGIVDAHHLRILCVRVHHLAVACGNFPLDLVEAQQAAARHPVHSAHEFG